MNFDPFKNQPRLLLKAAFAGHPRHTLADHGFPGLRAWHDDLSADKRAAILAKTPARDEYHG